jgi:flagellar basal body-associated protein FliL
MDKLTLLFEEFMMKAIIQTEAIISADFSQNQGIESFTANRDRLLAIISQIANQIDWNLIPDEKKNDLNRQLDYIKRLDEKLLTKLQEYREELKNDIEKTCRQKDNIKGYNLSDVK